MRISNNCSSIAWAAEPPQRCSPVQQALILPYYGFYGSASAEPFLFNGSFPADWGARLRRPVKVNFFPDDLTFLLFGI